MALNKLQEKEAENRCPKCGDLPTYQTPDGTYWDGNAHFWRVAKPHPENDSPLSIAIAFFGFFLIATLV